MLFCRRIAAKQLTAIQNQAGGAWREDRRLLVGGGANQGKRTIGRATNYRRKKHRHLFYVVLLL